MVSVGLFFQLSDVQFLEQKMKTFRLQKQKSKWCFPFKSLSKCHLVELVLQKKAITMFSLLKLSVKGLLPSPQKGEHDIAVSLGYSPSLNFLFVLIV